MREINAIRNCVVKFRRVCPETWDRLSAMPDPAARFCGACNRQVFLCSTDAEAVTHALAGHCIAKAMPDRSELGDMTLTLGTPEIAPPEPTPEERLARREYAVEGAKTLALRDSDYASRLCPRCGYPCADYRRDCGVCGLEVGRAPRPADA